jgi:hypothetical protein
MKGKAILVSGLTLLLLLSFAAPAMAATSKEIQVTVVRTNTFLVQGDYWYTKGDTFHSRDWVIGFNSYSITGDGISLVGYTSSVTDGNLNLKTGKGSQHFDSHLVFADGTFVGIIQVKGTFVVLPETYPIPYLRGYMVPVNVEFRGVWHGTGDYTGWIFQLEYEVVNYVVPSLLIGSMLIP